MTRRSPAQYNWDSLEFDETILDRHFTSPRDQNIAFVIVHHMAMVGAGNGSALDACYNTWQTRQASAHYGCDGGFVRQFVWDSNAAWSTGNYAGNHGGISIEHANSLGDPGWQVSGLTWTTGAKLAAYLHKAYGLGRPTSNSFGSGGTLRAHRSFFATACPGPYLMGLWQAYLAEAQRVYDVITAGGNVTAPVAATPVAKTISELADEVLAGKHGNGDQRRASLGANFDAVQAEINRRAGVTTAPKPQPVNIGALADAVLRGEYGSGDERRRRLGTLFDAVQTEVNRKLGAAGPSLTTIAQQVIAGQWGTGTDRIRRLQNAGYNYAAVQAEVNRLLG